MDLLLPADVEQAVIDELSAFFTIGSAIPEVKPNLFLRVNAAGGFQRDLVTDTFTITLEAFGALETPTRNALATAIARLQDAQRLGAIGGIPCYRLQISGLPQNLPHPTVSSHKRYIATLAPDLRRQLTTI